MKTNRFDVLFLIIILVLLILLAASARGQENQISELQLTGGTFTMTKNVVAGGGQTMQSASMNASATAGQTAAGKTSSGGQFSLYSGFWTPDNFTPTAGTATVGGRVKTADGAGIRNAVVTITYPNGETHMTLSSSMGYYSFADIPVGDSYIISVSAKRFRFGQPSQIRNVIDDLMDVDFIANAQV